MIFLLGFALELLVILLANRYYSRIETCTGFSLDVTHGVLERNSTAILTVRR